MAWSSPLPVGARTGSNFGPRKGILHAGDDFPPPSPGQQGVDVYAIGDGIVIGDGAGLLSGHSGDRNVLIQHPGGVVSYYGHLNSNSVSKGQKVKGGQHIGEMGYRGNVYPRGKGGTHLHLGIIVNGRFVDPSVWLASKGIYVGRTKPVTPKASSTTTATQRNINIQRAMRDLGYYKGRIDGINGPMQKAAVSAFQKDHGLYVDGYYGPKTQAKWKSLPKKTVTTKPKVDAQKEANKNLQRALNMMKSNLPKLQVDGILGRVTERKIAEVRQRNGFGYATHTNPSFRAFLTRTTGIKV